MRVYVHKGMPTGVMAGSNRQYCVHQSIKDSSFGTLLGVYKVRETHARRKQINVFVQLLNSVYWNYFFISIINI